MGSLLLWSVGVAMGYSGGVWLSGASGVQEGGQDKVCLVVLTVINTKYYGSVCGRGKVVVCLCVCMFIYPQLACSLHLLNTYIYVRTQACTHTHTHSPFHLLSCSLKS